MSWWVFESDERVDVVPDYGKAHSLSDDCWCFYTVEHYDDRDLIIHNQEN